MTEKEKELKAFNQCADALNTLDKKSIFKVFQLLSIHFDFMPLNENGQNQNNTSTSSKLLTSDSVTGSITTNGNGTAAVTNKKTTTQAKKGKNNSSGKNPVFLADFDFMPSGKETLREFHSKFSVQSNYENNLIFIYYLQETLNEHPITVDHVFSCYRHLGLKIPSIPQSLRDTKNYKGWVDSNLTDLKVTRAGINYLEHEIGRND